MERIRIVSLLVFLVHGLPVPGCGDVIPSGYSVDVCHYGAVGDGVTDDTAAIQEAADAVSSGGVLYFPPGEYLISDTIEFGRFSVGGDHNVHGYAFSRHGIRILGGGDPKLLRKRVIWGGGVQSGDSSVECEDDKGTYRIITNAKPMFSFVACSGVTVENMVFDGRGEAFAGIQFDGNHSLVHCQNCEFRGCYIGCRNGVGWDHVRGTSYYGYHSSPHFVNAVGMNVSGFGGPQADSHRYVNCEFTNSTIGYSCESAQALGVAFESCAFSHNTYAQVVNVGGRLTFANSWFGGTPTYDIKHLTSSCILTFIEHHVESVPTLYGFQSMTSSSQGPKLVFINAEFNTIDIACGGATISAIGSNLDTIHRSADYDREFYVTLDGTRISEVNLAETAYPEKVHIAGMNVRVNNETLLAGAGAQQCRRAVFNVYPPSAYSAGGRQSSSVSALTVDYSIVPDADDGVRFTNTEAAGIVTARLGLAVIGRTCSFTRTASHAFRIAPEKGDCFRGRGAGKYLELDSDGDSITVECLTPGVWDIVSAYDPNGADAPFDWEP